MSKEKFCELMNEFEAKFRENEEWATKLYEVLGNADEIYNHDYMAIAIKVVEYAVECKTDSDDMTDISWWIFEDDFGKKGWSCEYKGEKYYPNSAGELYDMIMDINECDKNE